MNTVEAEKQNLESSYTLLIDCYNQCILTTLQDFNENYDLLKECLYNYKKVYDSLSKSSCQELVDFCYNDPKYAHIIDLCFDKLSNLQI